MKETAFKVRASGAHMLRAGAYKPRTSPYSFQGLGEQGLKILARWGRDEHACSYRSNGRRGHSGSE
jgi:3-deoxy-7-phosphoheptulonate synthase